MSAARELPHLPVFPLPADLAPTAERWLQIGGLVQTPLTLTWDAILGLPAVELAADFTCDEGWRVPGLRWTGVRVADLLALAQPRPAARFVAVGAGAFVSVLPLAQVDETGPLLAFALDGAPLPPAHGGPLRLIAPWTACYQSVKWVDRLELTDDERMETAKPVALARLKAQT